MDIYHQRRLKSITSKKPIDFYMIWYYSFYIKNSKVDLLSKISHFHKETNKESIGFKPILSSSFSLILSYERILNLMIKFGISFYIIKRYDSVLILTVFWPVSSLIHKYLGYFNGKIKKNKGDYQSNNCNRCYFCQVRRNYLMNKLKYEVYEGYLYENKEKIVGYEMENDEKKVTLILNDLDKSLIYL